jgi:hypothetical protein
MRAPLLAARSVLLLALAMPWLGPTSALAQQNTIVYRQVPYTNAHPSPIPLPWDASGYPIFSVLSGQLVLDLDGDGQPDVGFNDDDMAFHIYGVGSTRVLTYPPAGLDINSFLPVLAAGTEIAAIPTNASLIWRRTVYLPPTGQPYSATYNGCVDIGYPEQACFGLWQGVEGYTAVEFTMSNETHYAWIHVGVPFIGAQGGYVRSYAYDIRPNTPIIAGAGEDSDGDGVWDYLDQCPGTPAGAIVDANGCSSEQLCPCDGPWRNHGDYVSHVQAVVTRFVREGLIIRSQAASILKQAAASDCGKPTTRTRDRH